MSLRASDSLHPGILERFAWRFRRWMGIQWERFTGWCVSDEGKSAEWSLAALMAAGVLYGLVQMIVERS